MHSRGNSATNQSNSPPKNVDTLAQSPAAPSNKPADSSNVAAFSDLLPLGNLPTTTTHTSILSSGHGPISGIHKLPPRPRPGRKADPNPASTRKGQSNRLAQQKHRLKKKQLELQEIERQRKQVEENNRLLRQNAMLMHENKRLKQAHVTTPGPLSPALTSSASPNSLSLAASQSPQPITHQSPAKPAPGGCGRCVEGGECPCVDSLLETGELEDPMALDESQNAKLPSAKQQRPSLSIQSLLSPTTESSNPMETTVPSTQTHHEHEIDFTTAFRHESDRNTYDPVISTAPLTTCGGCPPDDTSCLCRKANRVAGSPEGSTTSSTTAQSRATSTAGNGPGSCARCQADPKQRAWCQGLALENLGSPISSAASDNDGDYQQQDTSSYPSTMKGSSSSNTRSRRRDQTQYETISCAEAYSVQQRFAETSIGGKSSKRKSSTPISAIDVLNSVRERPREYSAFEVDIGTVLSNLKHCSPRRQTNAR